MAKTYNRQWPFSRGQKKRKNTNSGIAECKINRYCARRLQGFPVGFLHAALGRSLAGKAAAFDAEERRFESCRPSQSLSDPNQIHG